MTAIDTPKRSRFRGVSWHKKDKKWRALINDRGRFYFLGNYDDEETAARVWDVAARAVFAGNARINFDGEAPTGIPRAVILDRLFRAQSRQCQSACAPCNPSE